MSEEAVGIVDIVQSFKAFLETFQSKDGVLKYRERIHELIRMNQKSLIVDFDDLILHDRELANYVLDKPLEALNAFSQALLDIVSRENPEYARLVKRFYVRIRNPPEIFKIRGLNSDYIGKLVAIEGIVTRVTRIDAKLVKAVYRHVAEGEIHEFEYPPEGSITEKVEKPPYCLICRKPGKFDLVVEKSEFIDWQKIVVQEKPEEVPGGQIPRSIEAILTADIVDSVRPGDRVILTGVLRVQPLTGSPEARSSRSLFSFYIDVNHVEVQEKVLEEIVITREDEERIRELARDPWIREKIISSIAPGIYGYWDIKEAIALMLFGGSPKLLPDGTRIRGDIHVLITGDPGTAKSQLLQFTARIAPRGLYTSGKGSTAAGLTATVLRDKLTGEYYLEAGALVLADGGLACIDEIDKMREEDRSAIHEALEQQTVSIAKAGIVARLNARASVLAAGNPKHGRYDPTLPVSKNIDLPPTILSRFDLIFIVRDIPHKERDRKLAKHILGIHAEAERARSFIDPQLLKKYVSYARRYIRPQLTPEAAKLIEEFYVSLRQASLTTSEGEVSAIAITPRQLEALIRLTEAHAKMALKQKATIEDAEEAIRIMMTTLSIVGIDVETGRLDIDVLETGVSASKREKKKRFTQFLFKLLEEVGGEIEMNELYKKAADQGFEKEFVREVVMELKNSGELYEPRIGKIAKVK
jgi:replicative DNA helicase Mcm